jgi:NADH-quinone oxidoreductase subunit L
LMAGTLLVAIISIAVAYNIYVKKAIRPPADETGRSFVNRWVYNKFYIDEIYQLLIVRPLEVIATGFYNILELQIIDGIVTGSGKAAAASGRLLKNLQTGVVGYYILFMVAGILAILLYTFIS